MLINQSQGSFNEIHVSEGCARMVHIFYKQWPDGASIVLLWDLINVTEPY